MDPVRAKRMVGELNNQLIGGWVINKYKGAGKSAIVFEGEKEGKIAAVKVFDPELVERFGKSSQLKRIERECGLIGEEHCNLVQIYDGGECKQTGYLYVSMELIDAPNLRESLTLVPRKRIPYIISQIASAAQFLESKELAHRDIKPENIAVLPDFSKAVLLDLGVLRPFGDPSLTDDEARPFIGTLRYSSPEFLLRKEQDSLEGWRAITFYQLGAVLHDLIMRKPLFQEFSEPYGVLVLAVQNEMPEIRANDVSADLVLLAQNCLVKQPRGRIRLVSWDDFRPISQVKRKISNPKDRVKKRALMTRSGADAQRVTIVQTKKKLFARISEHLDSLIRNECAGNDSCPPMQIIHDISDNVKIRIVFTESDIHLLSKQLSIRFDCDLIDEATVSLKIDISACLQEKDEVHKDPPSLITVYKGALNSESLPARIQDAIWLVIDLAQRNITSEPFATGQMWLDLSEEMDGEQ